MLGKAVAKFGGRGRSWFGPLGIKRVKVCKSKLACRPKRSSIGDHNSYRKPRLTVNFEFTFQSSCAYPAHAVLWEEMKFVVEMLPLSNCPSRAEAMGSPVTVLIAAPVLPLEVSGNAVSFWLYPMFPCGSGTWKNGNLMVRNSPPNFKACEPLFTATFWMKSQTLLNSLVGIQSFAPVWL